MFFEQPGWQRREEDDSLAKEKFETVHRPGHKVFVCLMLGFCFCVLEKPHCRPYLLIYTDWLGLGKAEISLGTCIVLQKSLTLTKPKFSCW